MSFWKDFYLVKGNDLLINSQLLLLAIILAYVLFVSKDPMAERTMTPYQYVGNNPVNMVDPTGMNHHDYKLNSDGSLKLLNETTDDFDRIFREDGKKSITVSKSFLWGENPSGRFNPTLPTYGKKAKYNLTNAEVGFYDGFRSDSKYNRRMPRHHHVFSPYLNKTIRYDNESFNFIK